MLILILQLSTLLNACTHNSYLPPISKPKRVTKSNAIIVDNIYCNNLDGSICQGILLTDISDHFPVFCICTNAIPASNNSTDKYVTSYTVQNIETFKGKILRVNWTNVTNCLECQSAYSHFHQKFEKCMKNVFHFVKSSYVIEIGKYG